MFSEVTFFDDTWFAQAGFKGHTSFEGATFEKDAFFAAIKAEGLFTLYNAKFLLVPDFEQAHFIEAPRLDVLEIQQSNPDDDKSGVSARWRALKRLAVQGHDHERELLFFAEEIKALRNVWDKPWPNPFNLRKGKPIWPGGGRYWGGWFYQIFSDFGRSMLRPVLGWIGAIIASMWFYLSDFAAGLGDFPVVCRAGQGEPFYAALYLAIHKGSIVAGLGGSEKIEQVYACLYGTFGGDRYLPVIPDAVVYAGLIQTLFSAVMVFLFLLAVRNHFRIK